MPTCRLELNMETNLEASQQLVNKELNMIVRQLLCFDDVTKICSHQVCHHVTTQWK